MMPARECVALRPAGGTRVKHYGSTLCSFLDETDHVRAELSDLHKKMEDATSEHLVVVAELEGEKQTLVQELHTKEARMVDTSSAHAATSSVFMYLCVF